MHAGATDLAPAGDGQLKDDAKHAGDTDFATAGNAEKPVKKHRAERKENAPVAGVAVTPERVHQMLSEVKAAMSPSNSVSGKLLKALSIGNSEELSAMIQTMFQEKRVCALGQQ